MGGGGGKISATYNNKPILNNSPQTNKHTKIHTHRLTELDK